MLTRGKESGDYLAQIRNNTEEKTAKVLAAIESGTLPKDENGKYRLLELGIGGGESLKSLVKQVDSQEVDFVAVDVLPELAGTVKKELGIEALAADAAHLPLKDSSVSAVNASSIFHEISSYGFKDPKSGEMIKGREAVDATMSELNRVLMPEGVLAYRDVAAPNEDSTEKSVTYQGKSWEEFLKWFLDGNQEITGVETTENDGKTVVTATAGMHRELQRHYLMFRDYLRNTPRVKPLMGVEIISSEWYDVNAGVKMFVFQADASLEPILKRYQAEEHDSATGKVYKMFSDQFDLFYDDVIAKRLDNSGDPGEASKFRDEIAKWKVREGSERYTYASFSEMIVAGAKSVQDQNGEKYVLAPKQGSDIEFIPRYYYQAYLKQTVSEPEAEGKQVITFAKLPLDSAMNSLEALENSDSSSLLTPEALAKAKQVLRDHRRG
jgi:SAM-dependent methyltransferase